MTCTLVCNLSCLLASLLAYLLISFFSAHLLESLLSSVPWVGASGGRANRSAAREQENSDGRQFMS